MDSPNVVAIVQARMNSGRFPGKVLEYIYEDITVLQMVCDRLINVKEIDHVLVATSTNPKDDAIEQFCKRLTIPCFRGPEDNLMERMILATDSFDCDIIVDITADCPLVDPTLVSAAINYLRLGEGELDYCSNVGVRTFPDGLDVQVYTHSAFVKLSNLPTEQEHTGINFQMYPQYFKMHTLKLSDLGWPEAFQHPEWELTVDHPEDLDLLRILIAWQNDKDVMDLCTGHFVDTAEILNLICEHPALLKINSKLMRKKASNPHAEVIA